MALICQISITEIRQSNNTNLKKQNKCHFIRYKTFSYTWSTVYYKKEDSILCGVNFGSNDCLKSSLYAVYTFCCFRRWYCVPFLQ